MSQHAAPGENGPGEGAAPPAVAANADHDASQSTVGTGSVIGLGCLALLVLFVVLAIAYRLLGGSW